MQNESKPFGEKGTGLLKGTFHKARVRLTFMYAVILAAILFISSYTIYSYFSNKVAQRFHDVGPYEGQLYQPDNGQPPFELPTSQDVQQDLVATLYIVNGFLLILAVGASYWLAGVTLEPIQAMYDRQKRFLSDASHELRTPLAILQTDLENELEESSTKGKSRERVVSHLEEVERMGTLVGNLLALSRLDEEKDETPPLEIINLGEAVRSISQRLKTMAEKEQVTLIVPESTPEYPVQANQTLLEQVFGNIIKNAILYNQPQGEVQVEFRKEKEQVVVEISDTGVGISKEDLDKIKERFYRVDKSRSRQTGGSGLGLSIMQGALEQLRGTYTIKSELEKGTIVFIRLPLL